VSALLLKEKQINFFVWPVCYFFNGHRKNYKTLALAPIVVPAEGEN